MRGKTTLQLVACKDDVRRNNPRRTLGITSKWKVERTKLNWNVYLKRLRRTLDCLLCIFAQLFVIKFSEFFTSRLSSLTLCTHIYFVTDFIKNRTNMFNVKNFLTQKKLNVSRFRSICCIAFKGRVYIIKGTWKECDF